MNTTLNQAASVASLEDKVVLVTGATSTFGIGRICRACHGHGRCLCVCDRP